MTPLIRDDNQDDPFATNVRFAFQAEYQRRGWKLNEQVYDSSLDSPNFFSFATTVRQSKADTIFFDIHLRRRRAARTVKPVKLVATAAHELSTGHEAGRLAGEPDTALAITRTVATRQA